MPRIRRFHVEAARRPPPAVINFTRHRCRWVLLSFGRNGLKIAMLMYPDDLPLADMDADGYCCHFMHLSIRPTMHGIEYGYCRQLAWKKWSTFYHADVARWLTLSLSTLMVIIVHLFVCLVILDSDLDWTSGWLVPSLGDTGDFCCHYWQHILVPVRNNMMNQ